MRLSDLKPGDLIIADGRFTCLSEGETCIVEKDGEGLYVRCYEDEPGRHYLDGQIDDDDGVIVGFRFWDPVRHACDAHAAGATWWDNQALLLALAIGILSMLALIVGLAMLPAPHHTPQPPKDSKEWDDANNRRWMR